jgi:hypothetical protein
MDGAIFTGTMCKVVGRGAGVPGVNGFYTRFDIMESKPA